MISLPNTPLIAFKAEKCKIQDQEQRRAERKTVNRQNGMEPSPLAGGGGQPDIAGSKSITQSPLLHQKRALSYTKISLPADKELPSRAGEEVGE